MSKPDSKVASQAIAIGTLDGAIYVEHGHDGVSTKTTRLNLNYEDYYSISAVWEAIVTPLSMELAKIKRRNDKQDKWLLQCRPSSAFSFKPHYDNVTWIRSGLLSIQVPYGWTADELDAFQTLLHAHLGQALGADNTEKMPKHLTKNSARACYTKIQFS